jgi:hypothetical protein
MNNHKIVDGVVVALTQQEEEELIRNEEEHIAEAPERARRARDLKLNGDVDPIVSNVLRWNGMSEAKKTEWTNYRQALLDVPEQEGFPNTITWPTKPT